MTIITAILLVATLVCYMYNICQSFLTSLILEEQDESNRLTEYKKKHVDNQTLIENIKKTQEKLQQIKHIQQEIIVNAKEEVKEYLHVPRNLVDEFVNEIAIKNKEEQHRLNAERIQQKQALEKLRYEAKQAKAALTLKEEKVDVPELS